MTQPAVHSLVNHPRHPNTAKCAPLASYTGHHTSTGKFFTATSASPEKRPAPLDRPGSRDPTINLTRSLSLFLSPPLPPPPYQPPTDPPHRCTHPSGHDFRRSLSHVVCSTSSCTLFAVFSPSFRSPPSSRCPKLFLFRFSRLEAEFFGSRKRNHGTGRGRLSSIIVSHPFLVRVASTFEGIVGGIFGRKSRNYARFFHFLGEIREDFHPEISQNIIGSGVRILGM